MDERGAAEEVRRGEEEGGEGGRGGKEEDERPQYG